MSESKAKPNKIGEWFKGLQAEFKKIIWPDKSSVVRQTVTVTIITAILGLIIVMVDAFIQLGLDKILG